MDDLTNKTQEPPSWLELKSVQPLTKTRDITNLFPDTQKRQYPDCIVWLSERRCGMKLRHALDIAAGQSSQSRCARRARRRTIPITSPSKKEAGARRKGTAGFLLCPSPPSSGTQDARSIGHADLLRKG